MEFIFTVFLVLQNFLYYLVRWILLTFHGKAKSIPPLKNPLLKLSATTLAEKIRNGDISCEQLVKACIDRIKEVNPIINAVVDERFEAALKDARNYDLKLKTGEVSVIQLEKEKPLYGIPFTVKECCSLEGMSYTGCTLPRRGIKATTDGFIVDALKRAGAIPLCVTNTPELCLGINTSNHLFGETSNPYDTNRSAGGSSGGEGAIIASGASLLGVGSDIGGSIRLPAMFNGIFGHKPTPGIISLKGHHPLFDISSFQKWLVIGPLARYAEDLHLAMKVVTYKSDKNLRLDVPVDLKKLKVFYLENPAAAVGILAPEKDIQVSIKEAVTYLERRVSIVEKCSLAVVDKDVVLMSLAIMFGSQNIPPILEASKSSKGSLNKLVIEFLKTSLGLSQHTTNAIYVELLKDIATMLLASKHSIYKVKETEMEQKLTKLLGEDGVLIYPSFSLIAPFKRITNLEIAATIYSYIWNIFGFPATYVPMGLNKDGLPVGFQVIAAPYQDRLCLAVAKELDKEFKGWVPPPGI